MASTKQVKYYVGQPIVLIGFMGCGKSTLGPRLTRKLGLNFIDLDTQIQAQTRCSIQEIFQKKGELYFRSQETLVLSLALKKSILIATGGGIVERAENRMLLRRSKAFVIWVNPVWKELWERLSSTSSRTNERPLLVSANKKLRSELEIRKLWQERKCWYQKMATLNVRIQKGESLASTLDKILGQMNHSTPRKRRVLPSK